MCGFIAQPPHSKTPRKGCSGALASQEVLRLIASTTIEKINIMRSVFSICGHCVILFLCYAFPMYLGQGARDDNAAS
jgi:hypothetical protein